jgi:hypothetical protein
MPAMIGAFGAGRRGGQRGGIRLAGGGDCHGHQRDGFCRMVFVVGNSLNSMFNNIADKVQ